jgi:hypothetical protein
MSYDIPLVTEIECTTSLCSGENTIPLYDNGPPPGVCGDFAEPVIVPDDCGCNVISIEVINEYRPWQGVTKAPKYKGFIFDERTQSLSGPFVDNSVTAITTRDNSGEVIAVSEKKVVNKTNLLDLNNPVFPASPELDQVYPDIHQPIEPTDQSYSVVASAQGEGFSYRGVYHSSPFDEPVLGIGEVRDPRYYRNAYMAVAETNWLHLGDEHNEKQVHRLDLSFHKNSFGALYAYICNEEKEYKGQYKGQIEEHTKVFLNLRGRRFKIKLMIVSDKRYPWALREMAIGHMYGKSF